MKFSFTIDMRTTLGTSLKTTKSDTDFDHSKGSIKLNGECTSCCIAVDNDSENIQCANCKAIFHTLCLTHTIPTDFHQLMIENPCVWWFCTECMVRDSSDTKDVLTNDGDTVNTTSQDSSVDQVSLIVSKMFANFETKLLKTIDEKLEHVPSKNDTSTLTNPTPTYASVAVANGNTSVNNIVHVLENSPRSSSAHIITNLPKSAIMKAEQETLVLHPTKDEGDEEKVNIDHAMNVKKQVAKSLKRTQLSNINVDKATGRIFIDFPNSAARKAGLTTINENCDLGFLSYSAKNNEKLLPKITITGVDTEVIDDIDKEGKNDSEILSLEKQAIIDDIITRNPCIKELNENGHTVKCVYLKKYTPKSGSDTKLTVYIKVSPAVRTKLINEQQNTVFLGSRRYPLEDRYHYIQCYHCQLPKHTTKDCPSIKDPAVCLYCMGKHASSTCRLKRDSSKHRCAKCIASPHKSDNEGYNTHNSNANDCPVYLREINRLVNMTDLISKNVM